MGDETAARRRGEYLTAMGDLRHAVEARRADPTARHLLDQLREARAKVRSVERDRTAATRILARV